MGKLSIMGSYTMLNSETKKIIESKIRKLEINGNITSTWELLKQKDFHLNSDLLVIDRQEFRDLVLEVLNETLSSPDFRNPYR